MTIEGQTICPQRSTKYLGVIVDNQLCFHEHVTQAIAKGAKWTQAMKRMSRGSKGLPPHLVCRLYVNAAVPSFLCAVDIFLTDCSARCRKTGDQLFLRQGPLRKLAGMQRQATLAAMGAMRTTATDAVEVHVNLPPFRLLIHKLCLQATI